MASRLAVLLVVLAACSRPPHTVKSPDGKFQVTAPGHWSTMTQLHPEAQIRIGNGFREQYMIALIEDKPEADMKILQLHSDATRGIMRKNVSELSESGPTRLTIHGSEAVQYELRGKVNGLSIVYLHTTVEYDSHIAQILAWTLASRWSSNQTVLKDAIQSFKKS